VLRPPSPRYTGLSDGTVFTAVADVTGLRRKGSFAHVCTVTVSALRSAGVAVERSRRGDMSRERASRRSLSFRVSRARSRGVHVPTAGPLRPDISAAEGIPPDEEAHARGHHTCTCIPESGAHESPKP